jgi:hypothetical protein
MAAFFRWNREWYVLFSSPLLVKFISFHISSPFDSFVKGVWVIKKKICAYPSQLTFFQVPKTVLLQGLTLFVKVFGY